MDPLAKFCGAFLAMSEREERRLQSAKEWIACAKLQLEEPERRKVEDRWTRDAEGRLRMLKEHRAGARPEIESTWVALGAFMRASAVESLRGGSSAAASANQAWSCIVERAQLPEPWTLWRHALLLPDLLEASSDRDLPALAALVFGDVPPKAFAQVLSELSLRAPQPKRLGQLLSEAGRALPQPFGAWWEASAPLLELPAAKRPRRACKAEERAPAEAVRGPNARLNEKNMLAWLRSPRREEVKRRVQDDAFVYSGASGHSAVEHRWALWDLAMHTLAELGELGRGSARVVLEESWMDAALVFDDPEELRLEYFKHVDRIRRFVLLLYDDSELETVKQLQAPTEAQRALMSWAQLENVQVDATTCQLGLAAAGRPEMMHCMKCMRILAFVDRCPSRGTSAAKRPRVEQSAEAAGPSRAASPAAHPDADAGLVPQQLDDHEHPRVAFLRRLETEHRHEPAEGDRARSLVQRRRAALEVFEEMAMRALSWSGGLTQNGVTEYFARPFARLMAYGLRDEIWRRLSPERRLPAGFPSKLFSQKYFRYILGFDDEERHRLCMQRCRSVLSLLEPRFMTQTVSIFLDAARSVREDPPSSRRHFQVRDFASDMLLTYLTNHRSEQLVAPFHDLVQGDLFEAWLRLGSAEVTRCVVLHSQGWSDRPCSPLFMDCMPASLRTFARRNYRQVLFLPFHYRPSKLQLKEVIQRLRERSGGYRVKFFLFPHFFYIRLAEELCLDEETRRGRLWPALSVPNLQLVNHLEIFRDFLPPGAKLPQARKNCTPRSSQYKKEIAKFYDVFFESLRAGRSPAEKRLLEVSPHDARAYEQLLKTLASEQAPKQVRDVVQGLADGVRCLLFADAPPALVSRSLLLWLPKEYYHLQASLREAFSNLVVYYHSHAAVPVAARRYDPSDAFDDASPFYDAMLFAHDGRASQEAVELELERALAPLAPLAASPVVLIRDLDDDAAPAVPGVPSISLFRRFHARRLYEYDLSCVTESFGGPCSRERCGAGATWALPGRNVGSFCSRHVPALEPLRPWELSFPQLCDCGPCPEDAVGSLAGWNVCAAHSKPFDCSERRRNSGAAVLSVAPPPSYQRHAGGLATALGTDAVPLDRHCLEVQALARRRLEALAPSLAEAELVVLQGDLRVLKTLLAGLVPPEKVVGADVDLRGLSPAAAAALSGRRGEPRGGAEATWPPIMEALLGDRALSRAEKASASSAFVRLATALRSVGVFQTGLLHLLLRQCRSKGLGDLRGGPLCAAFVQRVDNMAAVLERGSVHLSFDASTSRGLCGVQLLTRLVPSGAVPDPYEALAELQRASCTATSRAAEAAFVVEEVQRKGALSAEGVLGHMKRVVFAALEWKHATMAESKCDYPSLLALMRKRMLLEYDTDFLARMELALERAVAVRFFKSSHVGTPADVVSALKGDADVKVDTFCRER